MRRFVLFLLLLLTLLGGFLMVNPQELSKAQASAPPDQLIYLPLVMNQYPPVPYNPVMDAITGADDGSYTVSWTENEPALVDSFILEEATDSGFSLNLRTVCTTALLSCNVNGKLAGTFYYRVRAENTYGSSEWSAPQSATVLLPAVPALNAINNPSLSRSYTVSWGAAARATSYTLQEDDNAGFSSPTDVYTGSNTSWNASNKLIGSYYYRVRASGPTGQSGWSGTQVMDLKPILLGQYSSYYGNNWTAFWAEMNGLDTFVKGTGGRSSTLVGLFYSTYECFDSRYNCSWVSDDLAGLWNNGYVPFINLYRPSGYTMQQIADGALDTEINRWADEFKQYADTNSDGKPERFAFIAPFQEMNWYQHLWGGDPVHFIEGYRRVQNIFVNKGIPKGGVSWVFAPNGFSRVNYPNERFEVYYPGASYVDAVAISAYNFGHCPSLNGTFWQDTIAVFNPAATPADYNYYLDRLQTMAPGKPVFIAQTATGDYYTAGTPNAAQKSNWLQATYNYFATRPSMGGIVYFNVNDPADQPCHYRMYGVNPAVSFTGYKTAVNASGRYNYVSPSTLLGEPYYFSSTWR